MNFKKALFISFISHCFVLTPLGNFWFIAPNKKTNDVQIIYYKIPPQITKAVKTTQAPKEEKPSLQPANKEPVTVEKFKKEKSQVVKRVKPPQLKPPDFPPKAGPPTAEKPQQIIPPSKENIIPSSIPGTTLPNTPECVSYYNYIREEIRRFLKRNYTRDYDEGDIGISFAVSQSGELISLNIIEEKSSNDPILRRISYESIKSAAPFKPFPKNLTQKQISFNLTVVFKHE